MRPRGSAGLARTRLAGRESRRVPWLQESKAFLGKYRLSALHRGRTADVPDPKLFPALAPRVVPFSVTLSL